MSINDVRPNSICITFSDDKNFIIKFYEGGTVEIGPGLTPDEAGMQAVDAMGVYFGSFIGSARAQAFEEAAQIAEDMTAARRAYSPRALGTLTPECEIAAAIREHARKQLSPTRHTSK